MYKTKNTSPIHSPTYFTTMTLRPLLSISLMLCVSAFAQAQKNNQWGVKSYGEKAIASASRKAPPKLPVLKPKFDFVEYQSTPEDPNLKEVYATQTKKERYTRKKEKTEKEVVASNKTVKTKKEKGKEKEKPKEYLTDRDGNPSSLLEDDYVNTSKPKNTGAAKASTKAESALFLTQTKSLVDSARTFSGVPYKVGGTDKNGVDCSGLVMVVYKNIGKSLPRRSIDMSNYGTQVFDLKEIKVGDLLFFDSSNGTKINHVGMVTGIGQDGKITFIHATSQGVMEDNLLGKYWSVRHRKTMRVLDDKGSSLEFEKVSVHASN